VLNDEVRGVIFLSERRNRRPFTQEDTDFIVTLGNLALVSEENVRNQLQIIEKLRLEKELSIAREIQQSLLPQRIPVIPGYEIATLFEPAYQVGGDYYDVIPISHSDIAVAIGDVSGKGTPAAMIMASVQASLRTLASMQVGDPAATIRWLNEILCKNQGRSNKYVTFFLAVLDFRAHRLSYVNAGHCYPLILKKDGRVERLETGGMVMGFFPDIHYRSGAYQLDPGDLMVLYTDGVSELIDAREEEFGVERMISVLQGSQSRGVNEIRATLVAALEKHRGDQKQGDDITLILLKRV
jgi:sigma-B regulation protein RsbU (phosphoserine phosphatase)